MLIFLSSHKFINARVFCDLYRFMEKKEKRKNLYIYNKSPNQFLGYKKNIYIHRLYILHV